MCVSLCVCVCVSVVCLYVMCVSLCVCVCVSLCVMNEAQHDVCNIRKEDEELRNSRHPHGTKGQCVCVCVHLCA